MNLTMAQLVSIMPNASCRSATYIEPINAAMSEFQIDSPVRIAAFLAQVGHESGQLLYVEEISSGASYEGRKDLGNDEPGDGIKFKGRGLIQITGRSNYADAAMYLDIDCLDNPQLLCTPINACRSAAWFWWTHGLNELADAGEFETITRRINGGLNGQSDRLAFWEVAKKELGA